jgi:ribosomal protein S18 acetylase RimI-like enzyme
MSSALLTSHFEMIMENAQIDDVLYEFDATEESHSFYLEADYDETAVIWAGADGYALCTVPDDDAPTVLLFHKEKKVVGLYRDMMAWIDPDHRGKGLGTTMIVEFAEHFGENDFQSDHNDAAEGLGLTDAGFAVHQAAREIAMERLETSASGPKI